MLARPVLSVDVVLLTCEHARLLVLLHRRALPPFPGVLALPGVAVRGEETLELAARRALRSKAGLQADPVGALHLEQVATFDALYRDPRGRTVSVAYLALTPERLPAAREAPARWTDVQRLDTRALPFDHADIVRMALQRLQGKLRYTNIAARLLAETFRLEELQAVYEAILGRTLNRSNFRTKLLKIGLIERAGVASGGAGSQGGRPAHLYRFARRNLEAEDREFV
jgi:8-oxo-dGTP diphosphatase